MITTRYIHNEKHVYRWAGVLYFWSQIQLRNRRRWLRSACIIIILIKLKNRLYILTRVLNIITVAVHKTGVYHKIRWRAFLRAVNI